MKSYGTTNVGKVRIKNDDSFYCTDGRKNLYIVADGMGGYSGGKIASKLTVDTIIKFYKANDTIDESNLKQLMNIIRENFNSEIKKNAKLKEMGTTLTCCFKNNEKFSCIHIGDTRAYHISNGMIAQLTEDHTIANFKYKNGEISSEELKEHANKNVLIKAIVAYEEIEPDFFNFDLKANDILIICSDGLTKHLNMNEILDISLKYKTPSKIADELEKMALDRGGIDNIAIVVVKG